MISMVHGHTRAQQLSRAFGDSPLHVDEWVLAEGREGRVVSVERTGLGSLAIRVRFSRDETKWVSPLAVTKVH